MTKGKLLLAVLGLAAAAVVSAAIGSALTAPPGWHRYSSERYRFSLDLPSGWRLSPKRLVPNLLMPREILSLGTFPMPVGGGGNCGREPVAAIERMRSGDTLVSVQEYAVTRAMQARAGGVGVPPTLAGLGSELRGRLVRRGTLWSARLPFRSQGRWFDALIYLKGRPIPARLGQIDSIVDHLRFEPARG